MGLCGVRGAGLAAGLGGTAGFGRSGGDVDALAPGLPVPVPGRPPAIAENHGEPRPHLGVARTLHVREVQAARGLDVLGFEPREPRAEVR